MSAQSWSVKGIDPKVREAVREAAARQGMSLGEYLNQALLNQEGGLGDGGGQQPPPRSQQQLRPRATRVVSSQSIDDMDDWLLTAPADMTRNADPARTNQRVDAIERRTQLAVTGLDRAVSTIDRSVLGLAGRVDDVEIVARESADRVSDALDHFRAAGEILSGRLTDAETEARQSREALDVATHEISNARDELGRQVGAIEETARRAEQTAHAVARDLDQRTLELSQRIEEVDADAKYLVGSGLAEARAAAEAAAREAAHNTSEAIDAIRALHENFARRTAEAETNLRKSHETLADRVTRGENEFRRAYDGLSERVAGAETHARLAVEEAANEIRAAQSALAHRLERAEQGARESTAGLRQAAGAAIADLRNAQLGLSARLKLVEENNNGGGAVDLSPVQAMQAALEHRLDRLERDSGAIHPEVAARLTRIEETHNVTDPAILHRLSRLEDSSGQVDTEISERIARLEATVPGDALNARIDEIASRLEAHNGAAQTSELEASLQRLAERIAETESTANQAIRTLEATVAGIDARTAAQGAAPDVAAETEAVRTLLESRINEEAQRTEAMVQELRAELVERAAFAREGAVEAEHVDSLEGALADVNRRLAAAERRQAQTIEAISVEIKRMSETVDRRLRAVETTQPGEVGASAVREEVSRLARALEGRFEEIERREASAFDRMGLEVGRLSERLEDRFATVESRSAQAIEQVGEQVARMAERFNQRQDHLARELGERVLDSEERSSARIADAISGLMHRLNEVETQSVEAVTPVARAMSTVASRLQALEDNEADDDIPTPSRRSEDAPQAALHPTALFGEKLDDEPEPPPPAHSAPVPPPIALADDDDFYDLNDDEPVVSFAPPPEQAPVRAAPLPPLQQAAPQAAEPPPPPAFDDLDDADAFLDVEDEAVAAAPPPSEEDDPFWTPEDEALANESTASTHTLEDEALFDDETAEAAAPAKNDYLSKARSAAQAAATPVKAKKEPKSKAKAEAEAAPRDHTAPPAYSLRGSSRVVLWGAAGAIALMVAGGAYVLNNQRDGQTAAPAQPPQEPQALEPAHVVPDPLATTTDPNLVDPLADPLAADAHGADPAAAPVTTDPSPHAAAAPAAPAAATPMASYTPRPTTGAAAQATTVAAPLPPRAVSLDNAAARGDAVAQYELALQRLAAGRAPDGVTLLRQSANQGLAMAQYRLAKLYERGEGVPADLTQARAWTERAAAAGNRRAMHDLGVYFARGEGAPLDEAAAFRWFRQAAELGVADSQFNLGVLYQQGRGVGANPSEALFWYLVAARQGDEDAGARANALEASLQPIQVEQARARAGAFRPRAASARANGEFGPRPWAAGAQRAPAT